MTNASISNYLCPSHVVLRGDKRGKAVVVGSDFFVKNTEFWNYEIFVLGKDVNKVWVLDSCDIFYVMYKNKSIFSVMGGQCGILHTITS